MPYRSAYCNTCRRRTLHTEYTDRRLSKAKTIMAVLTYGVSVPFIGLRKDVRNALACNVCGTPN